MNVEIKKVTNYCKLLVNVSNHILLLNILYTAGVIQTPATTRTQNVLTLSLLETWDGLRLDLFMQHKIPDMSSRFHGGTKERLTSVCCVFIYRQRKPFRVLFSR